MDGRMGDVVMRERIKKVNSSDQFITWLHRQMIEEFNHYDLIESNLLTLLSMAYQSEYIAGDRLPIQYQIKLRELSLTGLDQKLILAIREFQLMNELMLKHIKFKIWLYKKLTETMQDDSKISDYLKLVCLIEDGQKFLVTALPSRYGTHLAAMKITVIDESLIADAQRLLQHHNLNNGLLKLKLSTLNATTSFTPIATSQPISILERTLNRIAPYQPQQVPMLQADEEDAFSSAPTSEIHLALLELNEDSESLTSSRGRTSRSGSVSTPRGNSACTTPREMGSRKNSVSNFSPTPTSQSPRVTRLQRSDSTSLFGKRENDLSSSVDSLPDIGVLYNHPDILSKFTEEQRKEYDKIVSLRAASSNRHKAAALPTIVKRALVEIKKKEEVEKQDRGETYKQPRA